jgi:hypothetical protein
VYEAPYTGLAPQGPKQLFDDTDLDRLFTTLESRQLPDIGDTSVV